MHYDSSCLNPVLCPHTPVAHLVCSIFTLLLPSLTPSALWLSLTLTLPRREPASLSAPLPRGLIHTDSFFSGTTGRAHGEHVLHSEDHTVHRPWMIHTERVGLSVKRDLVSELSVMCDVSWSLPSSSFSIFKIRISLIFTSGNTFIDTGYISSFKAI